MESKFKVSVIDQGDKFRLAVTNRAGRQWIALNYETCPGNAAEDAMVVQEYLDNGGKLVADAWRENDWNDVRVARA